MELARGLLARGASVGARDGYGHNATYYASRIGNVALVTLLLDHGGDASTRDEDRRTALMMAAYRGHLAVCLLLLSRGANLTAVMYRLTAFESRSFTALGLYGEGARPHLSPAVKAERRAALTAAWRAGPHPTQVKRRQDEAWARRWPLMQVVVFHGHQPLAYRRDQLAAAALPPSAPLNRTRSQVRARTAKPAARARDAVLSNEALLRLVAGFL